MRIISGTRRGMTLLEFKHPSIRPTTDKVKGSVFNMLMNLVDISVCRVLDLFSGTGNLGLEALSRGAVNATFVESDPQAVRLLKQNVHKAGFGNNSRVVQLDATLYLAGPPEEPYEILFADPPYHSRLGNFIIENVFLNRYLAPCGLLTLETSAEEVLRTGNGSPGLNLIKERIFRETRVTIFQYHV